MFLVFGSLGCGIGYGYLHRIPTQPPSHHKKPSGVPPPGVPPPGIPPLGVLPPGVPPPGAPPPGPTPQDSPAPSGLETGSRQGDYVEVCGEHLPAVARGELHVGRRACSWEKETGGCPHWGPACRSLGRPICLWDPVGEDGPILGQQNLLRFSCHLGLEVRVV